MHPEKKSWPWLTALGRMRSASSARAGLLSRYPSFAPGRLRQAAVVGAASEGRRLVDLCGRRGISVRAVLDDDPALAGKRVGPCRVAPLESLQEFGRSLPVVIASHRILGALDRVRRWGFKDAAPFALLQVLDPASYRPHMFYEGWLEDLLASRPRYRALADSLADDRSRAVLDAVIGFRLTLDASVLRKVVEPGLYAPAGLVRYGKDEVYVDGGAFDGDSVRAFIRRVAGRFSRVLAFEPDRATFLRLKRNFAPEKRVEAVNAGLHRRRGRLAFDNAGTRGSALTGAGAVKVPVVALDEVLDADRVTAIKLNIEGAELDALRGAAASIRRWMPSLAVSAYHRPSHLWEVPAAIRALSPGYRLYLRQHDGGVIETVAYALPEPAEGPSGR